MADKTLLSDEFKELCRAVGIKPHRVERPRTGSGCDGTVVIIRTRLGGGNRLEYEDAIRYLRSSDKYLYDHDESGDQTYARFIFEKPEDIEEGYVDVWDK